MSLSTHFKKSVCGDKSDLSWLSAASLTAVGLSDEKPETKKPVVPKDSLPSKGMSTYVKNVRFNAYKSTRPALLLEINSILSIGEKKLIAEYGENVPQTEFLNMYAEAFNRYIEESTLYQPFLSKVKAYYDESIKDKDLKLEDYQNFDSKLDEKDELYARQLNEATLSLKAQVEELNAKLKASKVLEDTFLENVKVLTQENGRLVEMNTSLRKEADTSRSTSASLASALARMAEEKLKFDMLESCRLQEISSSKQLEVSLNTELDRLHRMLAEKEAVHETLVSPDKLAAVSGELALIKQENKRLTSAHRHLLLRYAALKFMIDGAFKRLDDMKEQLAPLAQRNVIQSQIQSIMDDYKAMKRSQQKKQEIRQKTPHEKIITIVESTQYPKVVFEALLDQIEVLQTEKRRLLFGDNADLLDDLGEEGDEEAGMEELLIPGTVLEGLGTGEDVPVYLRYEGQIRNINIGRKAIVELAHEICTAKAAHEVSGQLIGSQSPGALPTSKKLSKAARAAARNGVDASAAGCAGAEGDSDSDLDSVNSRTSHGRPGSSVGFHSPFLRPLSPELAALSAHGLAMNASDSYVPLLPSLPPTASMAEFFCCFLKDKMGDDIAGIEQAYNIVDALRRFSDHSDCQLFSALLEGRAHPTVWFDRVALVEKLRSAVIKENATNTRSADGEWKLTPEKFMKVVRKVLNTRTEEEFEKLGELMALEQNPESRYVNATLLLWDGEEGERSPFLELVKAQHLEDCESMERVVRGCIEQVCETEPPGVAEISLSKLREALVLSDVNKTRGEINQLLARGAGCTLESVLLKEAKRVPVLIEEFKVNIRAGVLKKSAVPQPKKPKK